MGIRPSSVAQWEIGRSKPGLDKLLPLSRLYGVPLAELCGDDIPGGVRPAVADDSSLSADRAPFHEQRGQLVKDLDELALLAFWRTLTPDERIFMLGLLRNGALSRRSA